jgi:predicted transcriptional regulator
MKNNVEISQDLNRRIDMLTSRSTLTRDQIIEDALSHGRSLAWQEKWVAGVQAGIEAADPATSPTKKRSRRFSTSTVRHEPLCELSGPDTI